MNRTKLRRKAAVQTKCKQVNASSSRINIKTQEVAQLSPNVKKKKKKSITKPKKVLSKLNQQNIIDVIKCISGSPKSIAFPTDGKSAEKKISDESIIYVGTTFISFLEMPRKVSFVDLTRSDTTLNSTCDSSYNLDNYDISGDNIIDELHLKPHPVSSSASIFTIFPPKSLSLFSTPSDEMCACQDIPTRNSSHKRNLSLTDITYYSECTKKRAPSRNMLEKIDRESTDYVWKLKKSYPLSNGLCLNNTDTSEEKINIIVGPDIDDTMMFGDIQN